jgi:hypothetical protein
MRVLVNGEFGVLGGIVVLEVVLSRDEVLMMRIMMFRQRRGNNVGPDGALFNH